MPESGDTSRQRSNNRSPLFKGRRKALRLREPAAGSGGSSPVLSSHALPSNSQAGSDRNKTQEPLNSKSLARDGKREGNQVVRQDRTKGRARWWSHLWGRRSRLTKDGVAPTAQRLGEHQRPAFAKNASSSSSADPGGQRRDQPQSLSRLNLPGRSGIGMPSSGNTTMLEKNREARRQSREQSSGTRRGGESNPNNQERNRRGLRLRQPTANPILPLRPGQVLEPPGDARRSGAGSSAQSVESNNRLQRSRRHRREASLGQRPLAEPRQRQTRPKSRSTAIVLYATRMLILSIGVGVLAGTVLSAWDPATHSFLTNNSPTNQPSTQAMSVAPSPALKVGQEIAPLKTAVAPLIQQNPQFTLGAYLQDLDDNSYLDMGGSATFAAASTIKVPVLVAFFQDVDAGKIRLDEKLTLRKELIGQGSGDMQYEPLGTQYTTLEVARRMIVISDNTATNMLIARLGGKAALNDRFRSWGLMTTEIKNMLPDLQGTNTTSPKDLAMVMIRVSQGELISLRSRDRMLDIMRQTVNDSLLPQGLGEGATIAHKTGDISSALGDVGLIDLPNGKRYAIGVVVKRPPNNYQAAELIRQVSRAAYQHFNRPTTTTAPNQAQSSPTLNPGETSAPVTAEPQAPTDDSSGTDSPATGNTMQATR